MNWDENYTRADRIIYALWWIFVGVLSAVVVCKVIEVHG